MLITKTITITLSNDWTAPDKQNTIKQINNIPENVLMTCRYDIITDTTICCATWTEKKEEG